MARKSRPSVRSQAGQRDTSHVARSAAGSRPLSYWTDLPQSRPPVLPAASVPRRGNRRVVTTATAPVARKRAPEPVSFGTWSLPPTLSQETLQKAATCARRGIRREVMFAKRQTGRGAKGWKKHFSNRRCK